MVKAKSPGVVLRGILYLSKKLAFLTEGDCGLTATRTFAPIKMVQKDKIAR